MGKQHFDDDGKVIDFSKMHHKEKARARLRRKKIWIAAAVATAIVAVIGAVLYSQFREVTSDKSFWQNFQSSQQS